MACSIFSVFGVAITALVNFNFWFFFLVQLGFYFFNKIKKWLNWFLKNVYQNNKFLKLDDLFYIEITSYQHLITTYKRWRLIKRKLGNKQRRSEYVKKPSLGVCVRLC